MNMRISSSGFVRCLLPLAEAKRLTKSSPLKGLEKTRRFHRAPLVRLILSRAFQRPATVNMLHGTLNNLLHKLLVEGVSLKMARY